MDIDHNVSSFFTDLTKIRQKAFKKGTIIKSFRESGMWPPSFSVTEKKIAVYSEPWPNTPPPHTEISYELSS